MQSGEAQVPGVSRQPGSAVLKGVGQKGTKVSLVQLLFGTVPAAGAQTKPFGSVLTRLQGKTPVPGKSQSRAASQVKSSPKLNGTATRLPGSRGDIPTGGNGMSEAASVMISGD